MTELIGKVAVRGRYFQHCGYVRLDTPYRGHDVVLLNEQTKGRGKLPFDDGKLVIGTFVVITEFKMQGEGIVALAVAVRETRPYEKREVVVSLRRGAILRDLGITGTMTLAQFLRTLMDVEEIEDFPTGTTAVIRVDDVQLEKLSAHVGKQCHIVKRTIGRVEI